MNALQTFLFAAAVVLLLLAALPLSVRASLLALGLACGFAALAVTVWNTALH